MGVISRISRMFHSGMFTRLPWHSFLHWLQRDLLTVSFIRRRDDRVWVAFCLSSTAALYRSSCITACSSHDRPLEAALPITFWFLFFRLNGASFIIEIVGRNDMIDRRPFPFVGSGSTHLLAPRKILKICQDPKKSTRNSHVTLVQLYTLFCRSELFIWSCWTPLCLQFIAHNEISLVECVFDFYVAKILHGQHATPQGKGWRMLATSLFSLFGDLVKFGHRFLTSQNNFPRRLSLCQKGILGVIRGFGKISW